MYFLEEQQILEKIKAGDSKSFEQIVDLYGDKISRYLRRFLNSSEDLEDVWQEVFIKAYININSFEAKNSLGSWLYRIAHNEAMNHLRKVRPVSFSFADIEPLLQRAAAKEETHTQTEQTLIKNLLDNLLQEIDLKYREVLILYFYEELSYKEISKVLRIPVSGVGVRLTRAKQKMYACAKEKKLGTVL